MIAGAAPSVLRWTDEDERRRGQTAQALRGDTDVDADLVGFVGFFRAIGAGVDALAPLFDELQASLSPGSRAPSPRP